MYSHEVQGLWPQQIKCSIWLQNIQTYYAGLEGQQPHLNIFYKKSYLKKKEHINFFDKLYKISAYLIIVL